MSEPCVVCPECGWDKAIFITHTDGSEWFYCGKCELETDHFPNPSEMPEVTEDDNELQP